MKHLWVKIALAVLAISLALPFSNAFSASNHSAVSKPASSEIDELRSSLEYTSKAEKEQIQKYLSIQADRKKADSELATIKRKIAAAESRQRSAQQQADEARAEYAASQAKLDSAEAQSESADKQRRKAVSELYQNSSGGGDSILTADIEDRPALVRLSLLMKNVTKKQVELIVDASAKKEDAEIEKLAYKDAQERAEAAEQKAKEEADSLIPLREDAEEKRQEIKDKEDEANEIARGLRSKKEAYTRQINQLVAESNALAKKIREEQNKHNNDDDEDTESTVPTSSNMIKPINSAITSSFGYRTHPIYGDKRLHAGIDLRASTGTPVKAAKSGKVIAVTVLSGYGNVVIIDHGGGISTLYAHLNSFAVSNGARVTQGQLIAYSGMSGNVTGPHLHWEVRKNGTPVNPMGYL